MPNFDFDNATEEKCSLDECPYCGDFRGESKILLAKDNDSGIEHYKLVHNCFVLGKVFAYSWCAEHLEFLWNEIICGLEDAPEILDPENLKYDVKIDHFYCRENRKPKLVINNARNN